MDASRTDAEMLRSVVLPRVGRPHRYVGNEWGAVHRAAPARILLAVPDLYEGGTAQSAARVLYAALNALPDLVAERAFLPDTDLEPAARAAGLGLFALESSAPASTFPLWIVALTDERHFAGLLHLLALAGLPRRASERPSGPVVLAVGPEAIPREAIRPFVDACLLGDPEAFCADLAAAASRRAAGGTKDEALAALEAGGGVLRAERTASAVVPRTDPAWTAGVLAQGPVPWGEGGGSRVWVPARRRSPSGDIVRTRDREAILRAAVDGVRSTGGDRVVLGLDGGGNATGLAEVLGDLSFLLRREAVTVQFDQPLTAADSDTLREWGRVVGGPASLAIRTGGDPRGFDSAAAAAAGAALFEGGAEAIRLVLPSGAAAPDDEAARGLARLSDELRSSGRTILGRSPQVTISVRPFRPFMPVSDPAAVDEESTRIRKRVRCAVRTEAGARVRLAAVFATEGSDRARLVEEAYARGVRADGLGDRFATEAWGAAIDAVGASAVRGEVPAAARLDAAAATSVATARPRENAGDLPRGPGQPFRVRFEKRGDLRFVGHLDMMDLVLRALRRAGMPVARTQGSQPRPRVSFGPPLSVLFESESEWFDTTLALPVPADDFAAQMNRSLPDGARVREVRRIAAQTTSLMALVAWSDYRVRWPAASPGTLAEAIARFDSATELLVAHETKSREKQVDLKRLVRACRLLDAEGPPLLEFRLAMAGGGVRLAEAAGGIFGATPDDFASMQVTRVAQWAERTGKLIEPWG